MNVLLLAAVPPWLTAVGIVFFLGICVSLILIVLIQRPQGGGLGGAFGGGAAGSGQTAFGARTGDVLTWATIGIFALFLTIGALLSFAVLPPQAEGPQLVPAGGSVPIDDAALEDDLIPLRSVPPPSQPSDQTPVPAPTDPTAELPTEAEPVAPPPAEPPAGESEPDPGTGG